VAVICKPLEVEMNRLFGGIYTGKRVFVTGHTGFKGSWLSLWLCKLGAEVTGFSLKPPTEPNHFDCLRLSMNSIIGDITDRDYLSGKMKEFKPEIVFHLAAQPIVRASYADPVGTYATNVMGTLNVCEACRAAGSVRAIVAITTDKVYLNREWWWGYREIDELGGYDPYSSSKSCADILLSSYRQSYFNPAEFGKSHNILLTTTRAGNVIGGGDWAKDRLIPDIARAASSGETLVIRSPQATRPWQHVLECLSGYLMVGQKLLEEKREFGTAFNFGPAREDVLPVEDVILRVKKEWPTVKYHCETAVHQPHEASVLTLDCAKARGMLGWLPVWGFSTALQRTISWYRGFYENDTVSSELDLDRYVTDATIKEALWTR
jgi:CDP-glucose 4,6-dehydratase